MPSPFPGMDPYLEDPAVWPDFHSTFIHCLREAINERLPDNYDACVEERVTISAGSQVREVVPDVHLTRDPARQRPWTLPGGESAAATVEPVSVPVLMLDDEREVYVSIRHRPDQEVVAIVELLSPTNKSGDGRVLYLEKRDAILRQRIHLVEIDLLTGGLRLPMARPLPSGDYYVFVCRADRRPACDVYAWGVRHALPTVPVPLAAPDPDLPVDLARTLTAAYRRGRFVRRCRYGQSPAAPMRDDDRAWAADLGRRPA